MTVQELIDRLIKEIKNPKKTLIEFIDISSSDKDIKIEKRKNKVVVYGT